jgi:hypothetical protein
MVEICGWILCLLGIGLQFGSRSLAKRLLRTSDSQNQIKREVGIRKFGLILIMIGGFMVFSQHPIYGFW